MLKAHENDFLSAALSSEICVGFLSFKGRREESVGKGEDGAANDKRCKKPRRSRLCRLRDMESIKTEFEGIKNILKKIKRMSLQCYVMLKRAERLGHRLL